MYGILMCKIDNKVKFFHNWQAWRKVMSRPADNFALSAADQPPNFAPDILMLFKVVIVDLSTEL